MDKLSVFVDDFMKIFFQHADSCHIYIEHDITYFLLAPKAKCTA